MDGKTDNVFELTWDASNVKFTIAAAYAIPAKYNWTGKSEHIDFGHKRFVILTPQGCDNTATTNIQTVVALSRILNPSAKFFEYATVFELDNIIATPNHNQLIETHAF